MATPFDSIIGRYQPGGEFSTRAGKLSTALQKQLEDEALRGATTVGLGPMRGGTKEFEPAATSRARVKEPVAQFGRELEATRTGNLVNALMSKAGYLSSTGAQRTAQSELTRKLQSIGGMDPSSLEYKKLASELTGITFAGNTVGGATWPIGGYSMNPDYTQLAAKQQVYGGSQRIHDIPMISF